MEIGATIFATDQSMNIVKLARELEQRGYSSLYVPEHTHIPCSRDTPPPTGDEVLPQEYLRTLDPFTALAAAAAVTERLRIGTGICLVAQREVLVTAKAVATLDMLSGGRFVFGVGFGWNREEMDNHSVDFRSRRELSRERVLAMKKLWAEDRAAYDGDFVRFSESWSWPKPVQRPGPPVLIGGAAGPKLFSHIAEYADGWMPIGGAGISKAVPALRRAVEAAGRDFSSIQIIPFGTVPEAGKLEYYASLGIREVVIRLPSASAEEVLPLLDEYAKFV